MRRSTAMALIVGVAPMLGLVLGLGCNAPCVLTPDPDCDRTKTNHHCVDVCADNEITPGGMSADQGAVDSGILDGGTEG